MSRKRKHRQRRDEYLDRDTIRVRDALTRRYRDFKLNGPDPGDFCPDCREATDFRNGFLCCDGCGWSDIGTEAIGFENKTVA